MVQPISVETIELKYMERYLTEHAQTCMKPDFTSRHACLEVKFTLKFSFNTVRIITFHTCIRSVNRENETFFSFKLNVYTDMDQRFRVAL